MTAVPDNGAARTHERVREWVENDGVSWDMLDEDGAPMPTIWWPTAAEVEALLVERDSLLARLDKAGEALKPITLREEIGPILETENALSQAIYLCDHLSQKQSRDHPSGPDFVTHYVIPHGLWAAVLRERQNLRDTVQKVAWPDLLAASVSPGQEPQE